MIDLNKIKTPYVEVFESVIRVMRGAIQEINSLETERRWRY